MAGRGAKLASMEIGKFKDSVTIQQQNLTPDDRGGQAVNWTTYSTPWAWIVPYHGYKTLYADQLFPSTTHYIYIPYEAGIDNSMRVNLGGRIFNIKSVIDVEEAYEFIELSVAEWDST